MTKKNLRRAAAKSLLGAIVASTALTLAAVPQASAAPVTPAFGPAIDGYAAYDGQDTCEPIARPGVVEFRDLLNRTYGSHLGGITRNCDVGGQSEHKEGRALDYHFDINNPEDAAEANDVLTWLLATDQYGNKHAMFRRLGLMYVIWNRQIWSANKAELGWQPYSGDPHTNHIHFSFSWAGALKQTTWFTNGQAAPTIGRIGVLQGGALSVKEGTLWAGWTNQYGGGVAKFEIDGDRIGVLTTTGHLIVKDGTLYDGWVSQATGVADFHLAGDRIGIRRTDRTLAVKEGTLSAPWTEQIGNVTDFDLTPTRIGVVTTDGTATVKEGNLYTHWVNQIGGAADIELAGNRIGIRRTDNTLAVKDGTLYAGWTEQIGNVRDFELTPDRIGVVTTGGVATVKAGDLYAGWVNQLSGAADIELSGNRVGVLRSNGSLAVKEGDLYAQWTEQANGVSQVDLTHRF